MTLQEAQDKFAIRLYEWSLRDLLREMDEGCPLMSMVGLNNRSVAAFVSWVQDMPRDERECLAKALTLRTHETAATLLGRKMSEHERISWNEEFASQVSIRRNRLPPLMTADESAPTFQPVNPDECLNVLASSFSPLLGKPSRRKSGVRATHKTGDWKLITEFTFYRSEKDLRFEYQFVRKDGKLWIGPGGPYPRTLFRFYGVWTTSVVVPSKADSEPMAKVMAKLAEYFVSQADPLFTGLGVDD